MILRYLDRLAVRWIRQRGLEASFPPQITPPAVAVSGKLRAAIFRHCILIYSDVLPANQIAIHSLLGAVVYEAAPVLTELLRKH